MESVVTAGSDPATLAAWLDALAVDDVSELTSAALIDQLAALERLKSAAAARQARLAVQLDSQQRRDEADRGVPAARRGRGVASQVALARRESPFRGRQHLGLAKVLTAEMPATLAALTAGQISEWRATLMARETACLSRADRAQVDAELAPRLAGWGDAQVAAKARELAYRLDPTSAVRYASGAREDRRVTLRPAPDTMSRLSGLLPVEQGVSVFAALSTEADRLRSAGDERTRGQLMADVLVARVTGLADPVEVPITVDLVMGPGTLFGQDDLPAHVSGYGPIPAGIARGLVRGSSSDAWVRRLFTGPDGGDVVAMDAHRRDFTPAMRQLLVLRDQICRTPWCDAPIRHADHVVEHARGGPSTIENGQGLCEACNYAKSQAGWSATVTWLGPEPTGRGRRHTVWLSTPTGHTYTSSAPDPPGDARHRHPPPHSRLEHHLEQLLAS